MKGDLSRSEGRAYFIWKFIIAIYNFQVFSLLVCESPFVLLSPGHASIRGSSINVYTMNIFLFIGSCKIFMGNKHFLHG